MDDDIQQDDTCTTLLTSAETPLVKYIPDLEEVSWSHEELLEAQKNDDFCIDIHDLVTGSSDNPNPGGRKIKDLERYLYLGEVLYKRRQVNNRMAAVLNIVVPTSLLNKAIKAVHYISHGDLTHTLFKFRFRYYHPYETRHIKQYISECELCKN